MARVSDSPTEGKVLVGDCIEVFREVPSGSVNLIYMDPPFNSGREYNIVVSHSMAHEVAYNDTWQWGDTAVEGLREFVRKFNGRTRLKRVAQHLQSVYDLLGPTEVSSYLVMLVPRLVEMYRLLRTNGTMYVHLDPTMSHYVKVFLDLIFTPEGEMLSEIIWKRTSAHNSAKRPGSVHDVILMYVKTKDAYVWNKVYHAFKGDYEFNYDGCDPDGRKWLKSDLTGAGIVRNGSSGAPWRDYDPSANGRHWAIPESLLQEYTQLTGKEPPTGTTQEKLDVLLEAGLIVWETNRVPRYKKYLDTRRGIPIQDVWTDILPVSPKSEENEEFDGQKPTALLERIIQQSSNQDDLVIDPFAGSGTTAVAAQRLKRRWLVSEYTFKSGELIRYRVAKEFGTACFSRGFSVPVDYESAMALAQDPTDVNHREFEMAMVRKLGGVPNDRPNKGPDGRMLIGGFFNRISQSSAIEVKSTGLGKGISQIVKDMKQEGHIMGVFLCSAEDITQTLLNDARAEGTFTSGDPKDPRVFNKVQVISFWQLYHEPNGGLKVPGYIEPMDYTNTQAYRRRMAAEDAIETEDVVDSLPPGSPEEMFQSKH